MIRECTIDYKKIWEELNKKFISFEYKDENVWENPLSKGEPGEIFEEIICNPNSSEKFFLVEENDKVIGFMNTISFLSVWAHGKVLFLDDFFIIEEYRGRGYGKKAIRDLEEYLKNDKYKRIQIMAENTNPNAVKFYERQSYPRQMINFFCKYL